VRSVLVESDEAKMEEMNEQGTARLRMTADEERSLCEERARAEDHLVELLRATSDELELPDDPTKRRPALAAAVRSLRGRGRSAVLARRLHKAIDRLTWRLALSGMGQVDHQLRRRSYTRVSRDELRQAGTLGLFRAASRFDAARGVRFSTFCRHHVREAMGDQVGDQEYVTRLPGKARRQLRKPAADLSRRQARALDAVRGAVDLDAPAGADSHELRGALVPAPVQRCPQRSVMAGRGLDRLRRALDRAALKPRDRRILAHRYGLGGAEELSCRALGERLGVSGERVRQLQKRAEKRLRAELASLAA